MSPEQQAEAVRWAALSPEQQEVELRAARNTAGDARGCMKCPLCGDSRAWKPFHEVVYACGVMEHEHARPQRGHTPRVRFDGQKATAWLCEECWQKASHEERLAHHEALVARRLEAVKPVIRLRDSQGRFNDCPKDQQRFEAERAAIAGHHDTIQQAMTGGA